jgi:hypothetical protein
VRPDLRQAAKDLFGGFGMFRILECLIGRFNGTHGECAKILSELIFILSGQDSCGTRKGPLKIALHFCLEPSFALVSRTCASEVLQVK